MNFPVPFHFQGHNWIFLASHLVVREDYLQAMPDVESCLEDYADSIISRDDIPLSEEEVLAHLDTNFQSKIGRTKVELWGSVTEFTRVLTRGGYPAGNVLVSNRSFSLFPDGEWFVHPSLLTPYGDQSDKGSMQIYPPLQVRKEGEVIAFVGIQLYAQIR